MLKPIHNDDNNNLHFKLGVFYYLQNTERISKKYIINYIRGPCYNYFSLSIFFFIYMEWIYQFNILHMYTIQSNKQIKFYFRRNISTILSRFPFYKFDNAWF